MKTIMDPFKKYKGEYWKKETTKKRKGEILVVIVELTGMHKKSAIRKFKTIQTTDTSVKRSLPIKQGRPCIYGNETILALKKLWKLGNKICGELLHPMICEYIEQYKKNDDWKCSKRIDDKLLIISLSTTKRKVNDFFKKDKDTFRKGKSTTKPSAIKAIIPIKNTSWLESVVGEGQLDTVVHCGNSLSGEMAYILNYTDFQTYWFGLRAQMGKGQLATQKSLAHIKEKQLPFGLIEVHPDTGSEFINYHLKGWCDSAGIKMTRSRPNHKNDNMCVEERNGHIIRKEIGYIRIDCQEAIDVLNKFYESFCLFSNHFIAVKRTKEKVRIRSRYQRRFEEAKTPYRRVMESNDVSAGDKKKLKKIHESLSMIKLQKRIEKLKAKIQIIQKKCSGKLY